MTIPATAFVWSQPMDPTDVVDYEYDLSGLLDLANNEGVFSHTLVLGSEAVSAGLLVGTGAYAPVQIGPTVWRVWFSVDAPDQDHPSFSGTGAALPMEVTVVTDSSPARTRQRTLVLKVVQQ